MNQRWVEFVDLMEERDSALDEADIIINYFITNYNLDNLDRKVKEALEKWDQIRNAKNRNNKSL